VRSRIPGERNRCAPELRTGRAGPSLCRVLAALVACGVPAICPGDTPPRAGATPREIVRVTERTRELLIQELSRGTEQGRSEALDVLARVAGTGAADAIRSRLDDPSPALRAGALRAMAASVEPAELVEVLRAGSADPAPLVSRDALRLLGELPGDDSARALWSVRPHVAESVAGNWADAVARRDEPPPGELLDGMLRDRDPAVRLAGLRVAGHHPEILAASRRLELASDPEPLVRAAALAALADQAGDSAVRAAILRATGDPSAFVRRAAAAQLIASPPDLEAVQPLLGDPDATVRETAVRVAGQLRNEAAVAALLARLGDAELLVARSAADQLAAIGGDAVERALGEQLRAASEQVVVEAARALGVMRRTTSLPALEEATAHTSPRVRRAAYEAIARMAEPSTAGWLLERAASEAGYARAAINTALGELRYAAAIPHLLHDCHYPEKPSKGLNPALFTVNAQPPPPTPYSDEQNAVATAAVTALGKIREPATLAAVAEVAHDVLRSEPFWTSVAHSAAEIGGGDARDTLVLLGITGEIMQGMLVIDLPDATRSEALRAIARLGLRDLVPQIIAMPGGRVSIPLRQVAAGVLRDLTGETYVFHLPERGEEAFLHEYGTFPDLSVNKLPVFYREAADRPAHEGR
jgi:HEAT repeat protein